MASARSQGITKLDQIRYAIVQRSGEITIIKEPQDRQQDKKAELPQEIGRPDFAPFYSARLKSFAGGSGEV